MPSSPRATTSFKFNPDQQAGQELLEGPQRHTCFVGGSRSGKTTLLVRAIGARAIRGPHSRHAILRYRGNAARSSISLDTLPKVFRLCFPGVPLTEHRQDGFFSLPNNSEIWIGGLDDKDRVEKILGKEYATIFLNECSQIPYASVLIVLTRLAQVVPGLQQRAYYDLNPGSKGHWTNLLFGEKRDPVSRKPLSDPDNYRRAFLNPGGNADNLSAEYLQSLQNLPERQRKRFYEGAYVDEIDGALWTIEGIEKTRIDPLDGFQAGEPGAFPIEQCERVVVAVDPSGAASRQDETRDEIGIVVAAKGRDGHAYVLADRSLRDAPAVWGRIAATAFHQFRADHITAEQNFGGEMVRFVLQTADQNVPVRVITASRGKAVRAEPVSALYEQGRVHHVGKFPTLEDQLCAFTTSGYRGEGSPDHADAAVWALTDLMVEESSTGLIEYYKQQAEAVQKLPPHAPLLTRADANIAMKAPAGISTAYGRSGRAYVVDADGLVFVEPDDIAPLRSAGFAELVDAQG